MNPSVHLRIDSVIRALEDSILPAVITDERAAEQLRIAIAHLGIIRLQVDEATLFERFELSNYQMLATVLEEASVGGPRVDAATRELTSVLHEDHTDDIAVVRDRTTRLGCAIEELVRAAFQDGDDRFRSAAMTALLHSERQRIDANRALFLGMGWESGDGLPDVSSVVARPTRLL